MAAELSKTNRPSQAIVYWKVKIRSKSQAMGQVKDTGQGEISSVQGHFRKRRLHLPHGEREAWEGGFAEGRGMIEKK